MPVTELRFPEPEKVFTSVYNRINEAKTRFVINMGGTGSSKSFSSAQNEILTTVSESNITTAVFRKVANTLRKSVYKSFKNRIGEFDLWDIFVENKTEMTLTCTQNGSEIWFLGLDDVEKMKSIEGLKRIVIEEASEILEEDFLELNRRVRGMKGIQIVINFNPIHEQHWLKRVFFDEGMPDCTIIKSTYRDNPHLTDEDREWIEWLRKFNYNQYRVYGLGEWGITENKNPWLYAFDVKKHVKPTIAFLQSYPVYLSFDFNREPVTCTATQMSLTKGAPDSFVHTIKEFAEDTQLKDLCQRVKAFFPASILFVTGDRTGKKGDIGFEQRHATYYTMIQSYLNLSDKQMNIEGKNLEHNDSRLLVNTIMHNHPNVFISAEGCPKLVNECIIATVDDKSLKTGMLKKDRDIYKMDCFDNYRYMWQTYFSNYAETIYQKMPHLRK